MNRTFERGLVVGKFCPLHLGHELTIRAMLDRCRVGFVLGYTNPEYDGCEPERRRRWLAERFPTATSLVLAADDVPPNDADELTHRRFVAQVCRERLHTTVDAVFTSEAYGDGIARELEQYFGHPVTHICVDLARRAHRNWGTTLRADIHAHRDHLAPEVYADFVQRIVLLGGESSGKSTLAATLAAHFRTEYVPEYGRELWDERGGRLEFDDLLHIAREQIARERAVAKTSRRFLFCDTSPLTTLFYSRHMFGRSVPELEALAERDYYLHVLCAPDIPFEQDGTRQDAAFRAIQHTWYRAELTRRRWPWIEVLGAVDARVRQIAARVR
jgi:NadR type nicotinamide-nucleotide adenylyltransferase